MCANCGIHTKRVAVNDLLWGGEAVGERSLYRFVLKIPFNDTYVLHTFRGNRLKACCEVH